MSVENGNGASRWPHVPNLSPAAAKLVDRLKTGKPGELLTDEALSAIAGRDCSVGGNGYACLQTAIRKVERDFAIVWRREAKAGAIKCLAPSEVAEVANGYRRHIGKTSRRAVRVLNTIDPNLLPEKERPAAHATAAQLGAIAMFASGDTTKKLAARNIAQAPDLGKLLEAFPK